LIKNRLNYILTEEDDINSKRIQLLLVGTTACISLIFFITPTQGSSIVIGGNWTDIGTITFVSPKPGDSPTTAGTALLNTINGITDNSATNPYLIKLGPGIYNHGGNSLQMKPYVDIEGSGEKTTKITGAVINSFLPNISGTINGTSDAELRFLTRQNTGTGTYTPAIVNYSSVSPSILHVTANAWGGTASYGVYNWGGPTPVMTNVTAIASSAIYSYSVYNYNSGFVRIDNSLIGGNTNSIYNGIGVTTRVANTVLYIGGVHNEGTLTCVGAYDWSYADLNTSCQ
jgi:hypothetical protein